MAFSSRKWTLWCPLSFCPRVAVLVSFFPSVPFSLTQNNLLFKLSMVSIENTQPSGLPWSPEWWRLVCWHERQVEVTRGVSSGLFAFLFCLWKVDSRPRVGRAIFWWWKKTVWQRILVIRVPHKPVIGCISSGPLTLRLFLTWLKVTSSWLMPKWFWGFFWGSGLLMSRGMWYLTGKPICWSDFINASVSLKTMCIF